MGYITMGIIGFSAVALFFGAIFGAARGCNRAILRLILVVASAVVAIIFRETIVDFIMNLETESGTMRQVIVDSISAEGDMPDAIINIAISLIEIIIGLASYLIVFIALRFVSWMIIYPICKIFVKKGDRPKRFGGFIFGLLQGVVVAFIFCAPVTGIINQAYKLSQIEIDGQKAVEIPQEAGLEEYLNSFPYEIYTKSGGWLFDMVTSTVDADGNKITISDTVDVLSTFSGITSSMNDVSGSIDVMTSETSTPQEQVDAMKNLGDTFVNMGNSINDLSDDAKKTINNLAAAVKDLATSQGESLPTEVEEMLDNFDIDSLDFVAVGNAMNGIANYIEKTSPEFESTEEVTQTDVDNIINGIAKNDLIFTMLTSGDSTSAILDVSSTDEKDLFVNAINGTDLTDAQKDSMRKLFGLSA